MVAATTAEQVATAKPPICWSLYFGEDAWGRPLLKVWFAYYDANDVVRYRELKCGVDDGEVWVEAIRLYPREPKAPCVDAYDALKADLERHFSGEADTLYEVDGTERVVLK